MENLEDRVTPTIFTVDTIADAGVGSFRQAIIDANNASSADTIVFDTSGVFATPQTISLLTALNQISSAGGALTITGTGAANLTIRRDPGAATNFRIIDSVAPTLTLTGFTLSGGISAADGGGLNVGSATNATVDGMVFTGNQATGANDGGAINVASGGFLTVRNSTISGNTAGNDGGGIYFFSGGGLVVENSTISGNSATSTTSVGGGALYFFGTPSATPPAGFTPGTVVIRNSTINNNTSGSAGGAIVLPSFVGTLLVQNSTISGNTATGSGGGISHSSTTAGFIRVENSTIVGNTSNATAAGTGGGGISRTSTTAGSVTIVNSVVSGNTNANGPDILSSAATTTNVNFSLVGSNTGFTQSGTSGNNLAFGTDPQLGALGNNGGPTQTMLPAGGSPLVGAGSNALAPAGFQSDQRGFGYVRNFNGTVDIGSVEVQPVGMPVAQSSPGNVNTPGGTSYTFDVLFADPTGSNNGINVSSIINNNSAVHVVGPGGYDVAASYVSINNSSNGTPRTATYSITPPGGTWEGTDNGVYSIVIQASQVLDIDGNSVQAGSVGSFSVGLPITVTVTNADDSGVGSLRDAVNQVNFSPSNDTIVFSSFFNTPRTISLLTALPTFTAAAGGLVITGPGTANLTVRRDSSAGSFRIFDSTTPSLSISDLTISGGVGTTGGGLQSNAANSVLTLSGVTFSGNGGTSGGGLYVTGTNAFASLNNATFIGNGSSGSGGGVFMTAGTFLSAQNSNFTGNAAQLNGGGIHFVNGGSLVLDRSTISGNVIGTSTGGGGLYFLGTPSATPPAGFTAGTLVIRNSSISNNTSGAAGGGIVLPSFTGTLALVNSTISGNTAATSGGGIANTSGGGNLTVVNSTIAGNTAGATAANTGGGGIARTSTTAGTITVANSVVSGNSNAIAPDIVTGASGSTVNVNFSAVGSNAGFALSGSSGNNLAFGTNLLLGPLANYGGTTRALAPLTGSPLIGAGSDALIPSGVATDQRGGTFQRSFGGAVDIGAIESQVPFIPIAIATAPTVSTAGDTSYQFTVTYSDPTGTNNGINTSGIINNNSVVRVSGPNGFSTLATFVGIDNPGNGTPRTATYSISTPGGTWDATDNGQYTVSTLGGQVADLDGNFVSADLAGSFTVFAPWVVTNDNDAGAGSLRDTLAVANASPLPDAITFSPTFFNVPRTISLLSVLPTFPSTGGALTITGPSAGLTVQRDPAAATNFRVFDSAAPALTLTGFTITGGNVAADGAGLQASGIITLDRMVLTGNTTTGANDGGAIRVQSSSFLTLRNSRISGNTSGRTGGGIYFFSGGSLLMENSTITGNAANSASAGLGGGGIYFFGTAATTGLPPGFTSGSLVVRNSTIDNNTTAQVGGGIQLISFTGTLLVQNSTISGNTATASGGGIVHTTGSGGITLQNSTISGNTSNATGLNEGGGGIARTSTTAGTVNIVNSIVSDNINANSPDIQASAQTTTNVNFSAVGNSNGFTPSGTSGNNLPFGTNLLLGPLANNGGPTQTRAPQPGSPLLNAGDSASVPAGITTDQRGGTLARIFGSAVDIGSVEVQPPKVTIDQAAGQADPTNASPITYNVAFNAPVTGFTASDVSFAGSTVGGTLVANVSGSGANYTITVTGMTGVGTVVASIPAGSAIDGTGTGNSASTSADNTVLFDSVAPTVTINQAAGQNDPTNASPISYSVVFSEPVTGFTASDISFGGSTVGGTLVANVSGTGANYTVTVTGMTGLGTVVTSIPAAAANDLAGNSSVASTSTDNTVTYDSIAPTVTIDQAAGQADPTNASPISYSVVFSEPVTGFTGLDIDFAGSTVGGTLQANVSGSGANYTVTVTGMSGVGTVVAAVPAGAVIDLAGNTSVASTSTDNTVTFDDVVPTVTINQIAGQADPTNASPITFDVLFNEPVTGFTGSDVSFAGSTVGGTPVANVSGSGTTYTVTVTGMTGTGDLVASILAGGAFDAAGNGNAASTSTDNSVHFDNKSPDVTINQAAGQVDPTNVSPITFNVVFDELVTGFDATDVSFAGSTVGGALQALVSGFGSNYAVTVTGMNGEGNVVVSIPAGAATDLVGNPSFASTSTDNSVRFDNVAPTVTIDQAAAQNDPTNASPVTFNVVFSEPVTGFTASDISLAGSTVGGTLVANVLGNGTTYTVTVTGMNGTGTVVASIPAAAAADLTGNASTASTSSDNTVVFDNVVPTVTINQAAGQTDPANSGPITFNVLFSEPVTGFNASDVSLAGSTVGGTLVANVIGTGTSYTVTVTGMDGVGTVVASIPGAAAADAAGNLSDASTSSDNTVAFDNDAPTVTIDQAAGQPDPTSSPIAFNVHFSEPVSGFDGSDISFAGSTVGGTLQANVTGSGADYTVTVTGMFGIGTVVASVPAGAASDVAANTNVASTSSDNTVTYDNIGHLGLDASVINVNEADGIATITVSRLNGTDGAISIDFAATPDTAHDNDFTPRTGTLSWASGEGGTKSFTVDLTNDSANEGREKFNITLSNLVGAVHPELFASQVSIAPSDPKGPGTLFDQDGDKVTLKLTGGGTLGYYLTDWDGDGKGSIELIELANTTPLSVVNLSAVKAKATTTDGGRIGLGEVTGTGVKSFNARLANLNGPGINLNGYLGTLVIGDVQNGADIRALGTATQKTRITAGIIGDGTDVDVAASLAALTATKIGIGSITAPSIGTLTAKGNALLHIPGDMASDVTVSGVGVAAGTPAVKVLKAAGSVPAGADITAPSIGSLAVGGDLASNVTVSGLGMPAGKYAINSLKVTKSVLAGSTISAPSIGTFTVNGSLSGDVIVSGTGLLAGQPAIKVFTVVGSVASDIQVGGSMTTVVTGGFNGTLTAASVGSMTVKGNINGDVTLTGAGLAAGKVALPLLTVTGSILAGAISAPNAGTITVKGDMSGDLNLVGPPPAAGKPVLSALRVTGAVSGSDIRVGGDVTTVQASAFRNSTLFAGYTGPDDGSGAFNFAATVGTFKVTGLSDAFANSTVIASSFKAVTLQSVKGDNALDKFGFIADLFYLTLKVMNPVFLYDIANQGPQGFGDFVVKLV